MAAPVRRVAFDHRIGDLVSANPHRECDPAALPAGPI